MDTARAAMPAVELLARSVLWLGVVYVLLVRVRHAACLLKHNLLLCGAWAGAPARRVLPRCMP